MILIRFNTKSKGPHDKWRVFIDGKEHQVTDFIIRDCVVTTATSIEDGVEKYNVRVSAGRVKIVDGVALITPFPYGSHVDP